MRIAFVNPSGKLGGAERVLLNVLWSLQGTATESHLLLSEPGPLATEAAKLGATVHQLPFPDSLSGMGESRLRQAGKFRSKVAFLRAGLESIPHGLRYLRQLKLKLASIRPDIVHSNGMKSHLLAGPACRGQFPLIWHMHDFPSLRPLARKILGRMAFLARGGIAISSAVAHDLRRVCPRLPIVTVPNAIDTDHYCPGPGDPLLLDRLAKLPEKPGVIRIGLIATYARWKGQDLFIEAASRLAASTFGIPIRFYIIGGPIYQTKGSQFSQEELRQQAAACKLTPFLGFIPFVNDPRDLYRSLDIVVHASTLPEPFGLTIAEAMACGRCVVVAQGGGANELFTPGMDALGYPPGDAVALMELLAELIRSPERRQILGERARRTAVQNFDRRRLGKQMIQAFEQLRNL